MNKDDIIDKIKKLLEINRANGATEAEEMAALERANVLMTKYQIEKYQLKGNIKTKNIEQNEPLDDKTFEFEQFCLRVGEFFGVLPLHSKIHYSFYGNTEQVKMAIQMTKRALTSQALGFTNYLCSDEYRAHRRTADRRIIKNSFHDGFFERLYMRLDKLIDERAAATAKATGTNLVVLDAENLLNDFAADLGYTPKTGKAKHPREYDYNAYKAGHLKGKEFTLLEEVTDDTQDQETA